MRYKREDEGPNTEDNGAERGNEPPSSVAPVNWRGALYGGLSVIRETHTCCFNPQSKVFCYLEQNEILISKANH